MRFFCNYFISLRIKLKFDTGIQNWMLILIFGSKSDFGDDFGQYDTKPIILCRFLAKRLLVTPKVLRDKNYLKGYVIRQ